MDEIAFATGATLSAMLGLMQWRVDRPAGRVSGYLLLWVLGFVWTFGNFLRGTLAMAGASADSASALFAENFAWSCTLLGPIAIGRLLQGAIGTNRASQRFMAFTIGVALLNLVMLVQATHAHGYHLDASAYPTASFYIALVIGTIALLVFRAHRAANPQPRKMPRWFAPAALLFAAIHTSAILLSTLFPNMPQFLLATAGLIGRHWTIPWSVLIAVSLAQAHYADVILKRSLWLLGSVALATWVSTQLIGEAAGLPLVITTLGLAALMLAAPYFSRALDTLVDKGILERPDYPEALNALDLAFRRATDRTQLTDAALASLRAALRVDARWIESERRLDITVSHQARTLMQQELAFFESVRTQLNHRLDALHFDLREERLKRLLTEAELKALRTQVDPHFLFNTLNTIADLISTNPEQAERMTERLAECFRYALAKHSRDLSTLDEELDFARHYLEIEQVRFGDRLRIQLSRGDATGSEVIPSLLLQPLLENAIRHGLAPLREGGCVSVQAHLDGERLHLRIEDDGVGLRADLRTGVGLTNVQERLRTLYAQAAEFLIGERPGGRGTRITIVIPLVPRHAH